MCKRIHENLNDDEILEMMHSTHINQKTSSNEGFTFEEFYGIVARFNNKWSDSQDVDISCYEIIRCTPSVEFVKILFYLLRGQHLEFTVFSDHSYLDIIRPHLSLKSFL